MNISSVLNSAWEIFKKHWLLLSAVVLIYMFIGYMLSSILSIFTTIGPMMQSISKMSTNPDAGFQEMQALQASIYSSPIFYIGTFITSAVSMLLYMFFNKFFVDVIDTDKVDFGATLSSAMKQVKQYVSLTGILLIPLAIYTVVLAVFMSSYTNDLMNFNEGVMMQYVKCAIVFLVIILLFIYPLVRLMLAFYAIYDDYTAIGAFKHSWKITKGNFLTLFILSICCFFLCILGFCCCCIGMLPAYAFASLSFAVAYRQLSPKNNKDNENPNDIVNENDVVDVVM